MEKKLNRKKMEIKSNPLDLSLVEDYLRINASDEKALIETLIEFSKEDIFQATGATFKDHGVNESYKMLQLTIITDRYENRGSNDMSYKNNNIYSQYCQRLRAMVN